MSLPTGDLAIAQVVEHRLAVDERECGGTQGRDLSVDVRLPRYTAHEPTVFRFPAAIRDRKSTRLNSSHSQISYAVFCLKKKKSTHTYCVPPISTNHSDYLHSRASLAHPP